jgi:hypothetical protein
VAPIPWRAKEAEAILIALQTPLSPQREPDLSIVRGAVDRYDLPNLRGLNFILHDSLGGGGSASLKTDAQGKTHGMALLRMIVEVPDDYDPPRVGTAGAARQGGEL